VELEETGKAICVTYPDNSDDDVGDLDETLH
jgi:hypothetical protein